jgi:hypothetical protein
MSKEWYNTCYNPRVGALGQTSAPVRALRTTICATLGYIFVFVFVIYDDCAVESNRAGLHAKEGSAL